MTIDASIFNAKCLSFENSRIKEQQKESNSTCSTSKVPKDSTDMNTRYDIDTDTKTPIIILENESY